MMTLKKVIIAFTVFTILFSFGVFAADDFDVDVSTAYHGNIFFDGYERVFDVTVTNHKNKKIDMALEYSVINQLDPDNQIVIGSQKVTVNGSSAISDRVVASNELEYGVYNFVVTGKKGGSELFKTITPFSICIKVPKSKVNSQMGVNAHLNWGNGRDIPAELNIIKNVGIGNIREGYSWSGFEKPKGVYKQIASNTAYLKGAGENGTDVLIMAGFSNTLYADSTNSFPTTDAERTAFANYVLNMLRIGDNSSTVGCVEIWNEPDLSSRYASPEDYAKLLKVICETVKPEFPDIKIGAPTLGETLAESGQQWLESFLSADLDGDGSFDTYKYFDVICVHAYHKIISTIITKMGNVKNILADYKCSDKKFYMTECGVSQIYSQMLESEYVQAQRLVRNHLTMVANGIADRYYIYDFSNDGFDTTNIEHTFGLCQSHEADVPCAAKPGLVAVAALNYFTSGMTGVDNSLSAGYREVIKMTNGVDKDVYVLFLNYTDTSGHKFDTAYTEEYRFIPDKPYVKFFDYLGNRIYPDTIQGGYLVNIGSEPIYALTYDTEDEQTEVQYINANRYGNKILVSGKITNIRQGDMVGFEVYDENHELVYVEQLTAAEDEKFEFKFRAEKTGTFIINLGTRGFDKIKTYQFEYDSIYSAVTKVLNGSTGIDTFREYTESGKKVYEVTVNDLLCDKFSLIVGYFRDDRLAGTDIIYSTDMTSNGNVYTYEANGQFPDGTNNIRIMTIDDLDTITPLSSYVVIE